MGAVTYPNQDVAKFVDLNFIPVQIETSDKNKALMEKYGLTWTPSLFVLDAAGQVYYRVVGFVPPEEFVPTFMVGKARWYFDTGQLAEARATRPSVARDHAYKCASMIDTTNRITIHWPRKKG